MKSSTQYQDLPYGYNNEDSAILLEINSQKYA